MTAKTLVTVTRQAADFLVSTENHGGYRAGECFACKGVGWIAHLMEGNTVKGVGLHSKDCPVAEALKQK